MIPTIDRDISYLIFSSNDIVIIDVSNKKCHNLIIMKEIEINASTVDTILSKYNCKTLRGGRIINKRDHNLNVLCSCRDYDIFDIWKYDILKKYPEIINRILISRISYAGKPSETDKFQGFWDGDVKFIYLN